MNNTMLDTLSTVIEYRDVESGKHVHRIRKFTEILLRVVAERCPEYNLTESKINLIVSASSTHDIGKIAIPDAILLAPRRLTYDEFRIMKEHTTKGCEILNLLDLQEKMNIFSTVIIFAVIIMRNGTEWVILMACKEMTFQFVHRLFLLRTVMMP